MKVALALAPARVAGAVLAALLAAPGLVHAQEEAVVVKRASELRESPSDGGRVLAPLAVESAVIRTGERQGPWVRVRTNEGTLGWVHLFDVGPASGASKGGSMFTGALRSVSGLFAKPGNQRATTPTATIGIRGLGAEDIASAQPNDAAVKNMQALRVSDSDARQFAREASLSPVRVDPLPEPARPQARNPQENLP